MWMRLLIHVNYRVIGETKLFRDKNNKNGKKAYKVVLRYITYEEY